MFSSLYMILLGALGLFGILRIALGACLLALCAFYMLALLLAPYTCSMLLFYVAIT